MNVFIIKTPEGFVIAEKTNYVYDNEATAKACARDKWGDENPITVRVSEDRHSG